MVHDIFEVTRTCNYYLVIIYLLGISARKIPGQLRLTSDPNCGAKKDIVTVDIIKRVVKRANLGGRMNYKGEQSEKSADVSIRRIVL